MTKRTYKVTRSRRLLVVVRRAIRLMEARGFRQGARGPGLCVGDAITAADPGFTYRWTLWILVESVICATTRMRHGCRKRLIPRWNDKTGRTKDEALALLRRVAAMVTP